MSTLIYGNPNREYLPILNEKTYLDSLFNELQSFAYPENDSNEANLEINTLINHTNHLELDQNALVRFGNYDTDLQKSYVLLCKNLPPQDITNLISEITKDVNPLIMKLKYHYNRVRPYQLAGLLNLPLYPFISNSANTPSYPSGHGIHATIFSHVIGNLYPQLFKTMNELSKDVCQSRLYMGLHYPSDINFSLYCSELIVNHPDFIKKYKL